jgi:hypothetical protein
VLRPMDYTSVPRRGAAVLRRTAAADGDRNAELSNANKSFADRRVTGDPPCSSPRRRATSTQILESTNNHKPYFIKHRTGFCLLASAFSAFRPTGSCLLGVYSSTGTEPPKDLFAFESSAFRSPSHPQPPPRRPTCTTGGALLS